MEREASANPPPPRIRSPPELGQKFLIVGCDPKTEFTRLILFAKRKKASFAKLKDKNLHLGRRITASRRTGRILSTSQSRSRKVRSGKRKRIVENSFAAAIEKGSNMAADKTKPNGVRRMVKGSDLLGRALERIGVNIIYGVPGEEILDMGLRRIHTSGNQFVQSNGVAIRLKSINWFGAEGENYTPHGTWGRSWRGIIDQIKQLGFNRIRLPFSGYMSTSNPVPPSSVIRHQRIG
jgi:hypothetical protein